MKDHERLTDAVKTVCEEQGISIIELAEQMPGWATNEQLSRWMHGAKRPHEWKRKEINAFFKRKVFQDPERDRTAPEGAPECHGRQHNQIRSCKLCVDSKTCMDASR